MVVESAAAGILEVVAADVSVEDRWMNRDCCMGHDCDTLLRAARSQMTMRMEVTERWPDQRLSVSRCNWIWEDS